MDLAANERIDELRRDGTKIIQSPDVFAFSLDAVLLADFARVRRQDQVVDLAAGNGAVGLFIAGRVPGVHVTMVELQPQLAAMARRSVTLNYFDDRVRVVEGDLAKTWDHVAKDSVDVVTCNPPYFKVQPGSVQNPNTALALARHELTTDFTTVVRITAGLLKTGGKAFFVHRPDRLVELLSTLADADLAPKRIRFVHPKAGKEANMVLIEAIRTGRPDGVRIMPPFVVYGEDGQYTPEMAAIFND